MNIEQLIEYTIEKGVQAYKRNLRHKRFGRYLDRHQPVKLTGVDTEFRYWREMAVYMMGDYILEVVPTAKVDVWLCGNDSSIKIEVENDEQEQAIVKALMDFYQKIGLTGELDGDL